MKNYDTNSILLVDSNNVNVFYDIYSDFVEGKFSLQMITEAYENYKKDTNTSMTMDEWRGTISKYALASSCIARFEKLCNFATLISVKEKQCDVNKNKAHTSRNENWKNRCSGERNRINI